MKNIKFISFIAAIIAVMQLTVLSVSAAYDLSPALEIIKSKTEVKKCGVINSPIAFSSGDFDSVIGKADYVTIMTLPEKSVGRLIIAGREVTAGQTVTRRSIDEMRFEPVSGRTGESSFTFCDAAGDSNKYGVCTVFVLEKLNLAPVIGENSFETQKNISYKGFFKASDPDGDEMTFSIVSSAKHGTVQLLDKNTGFFMYTPKADFTGRDIFSFRVCDIYGNKTDTYKVTVHITEPESNVTFSDMTNHWAHNSAIKAVSDGVFGGEIRNGKLVFNPDKTVTRGDFLAISMIAAGLEDSVNRVNFTSFSDDSQIPINIKSYAQTALEMGIINGYPDGNGGVSFKSTDVISRSEAAAILSRLLALPANSASGAVQAVSPASSPSLASCGILVGTGSGDTVSDANADVTRAQAAQIYCNIKEYISSRI